MTYLPARAASLLWWSAAPLFPAALRKRRQHR
jgi:hypothetical protein